MQFRVTVLMMAKNCSVLLMVAELGFTDTLHCHLYHQMKEG
jgi:hypothetical protein